MEALENLKNFCEEVNRDQFKPTAEAIDKLGNAMVEAARVRDGYAELVWQAGVYLLLMESENDDDIFNRFGYKAVACALQASLEDGTFPLGLGFITYDFLPNGGLEALVRHPSIQQALLVLHNTKITISLQSFRETPDAIKIGRKFLNHAQALNIPLTIHQQIAACMLLAATDKLDKEQVTRILLNLLVNSDKAISLFFCWRAACDYYPVLWRESAYMESLLTLLITCRDFSDQGAAILAQLHADQDLLFAIRDSPRLSYLMGLSGWWLSARHNRKEGENTAWNFVWEMVGTYPELGKALKSYLQNEHPPEQSPEEVKRLQNDLQKEMRILHDALRLRSYQGVPLTLDIQRHNLVTIFEPLYEALAGSSELPSNIYTAISELDASALLDDNPVQKAAAKHLKIIGELRSNMIKDYEMVVTSAHRALDLRQKLIEATPESAHMLHLGAPEILQEVAVILQNNPEVRWIFAWFLPEIVQPMPFEQPTQTEEGAVR